jgi:type II secretory pathway pseudopilin PulG
MRGRSESRMRRRAVGATLVELVVAIVVVGVVVSAAFGVLGRHLLGATDPMMTQQALAVARGLLDEVLAQGTDATDPDGGADGFGPESGESRGSATSPFDHVNDYHGYTMASGIVAFDGTPIAGLEGFTAAVQVVAQSIAGLPSSSGYWVTVTVTAPGGASVVLEGFRARLSS